MSRSEQRWVALAGLGLTGLFVAELVVDYTPAKISMLLILAFWLPLLVLHEVGHALMARIVGWHVDEMVIGFGKELFRFRYGQTLVRVRVLPVEGYIQPHPTTLSGARWKNAVIYLAGPGIELLLALGLWSLYGDNLTTPSTDYALIAAQSLALGALMGAGFNLLPYATGNGVSDGLGAILSLFANDEVFRHRLSQHHVRSVRRALYSEDWERARAELSAGLERYPSDLQLLGLEAVVIAAEGDNDAAFSRLENLGHPDDKPTTIRHELLLDAAWVVLLTGDRPLLNEAQQACERALFDGYGSVRGNLMLGRVLLERNQPQAAFRALMRAYRQTVEAEDEPQLLAYLIIAARELGHHDYASRFMSVLNPGLLGASLRARVFDGGATATP